MLKIKIEAVDAAHARAQLRELLGLFPSDLVERFGGTPLEVAQRAAEEAKAKAANSAIDGVHVSGGDVVEIAPTNTGGTQIVDESGSVIGEVLPKVINVADLVAKQTAEADAALQAADDAGATTSVPPKRGRGRPRKDKEPAVPSDAAVSQPAVEQNTGSAPVVVQTPATSGANDAEAAGTPLTSEAAATVAATPAASTFTDPDMRRGLQEMANAFPGDEGQVRARAVLAKYGYKKVKDVEAKDYAAIIADAKREQDHPQNIDQLRAAEQVAA